jgi:GT2 family glycosyltransferase
MSTSKIPVCVIVVSFNTKELTKKALNALFASSKLPEEVVVVDNDSRDGSVEMVKSEFPEVKIIQNNQNLGFAKANNMAIRQTKQPYVWLLNSDTETGSSSLEQLYKFMESHSDVGAVGPQLVYPTGDLQSVGGYFPSFLNVLGYLLPFGYFLPKKMKMRSRRLAVYPQDLAGQGLELDYVTGAAAFLRRSALEKVGLLAEDYFMYFEETDLCWRLKKAGWKLFAIPTEPVMHIYGGSFKTKRDPKRLRIFLQSLRTFVRKNYSKTKELPILAAVFIFGELSIFIKGKRKI